MPKYDAKRVEVMAQQCLRQAGADKAKATELLRKRVEANAELKSALVEPLIDRAVAEAINRVARKTRSKPKQAGPAAEEDDAARLARLARKQFERQVKRIKLLPFPGRSRKLDLLREMGDLRERVRSSLGTDCKLFQALAQALDTRKLSDIRHALLLYEAQPYTLLDVVWQSRSHEDTH